MWAAQSKHLVRIVERNDSVMLAKELRENYSTMESSVMQYITLAAFAKTIYRNNLECLKILLDFGVDPSAVVVQPDGTALQLAARLANYHVFKELLYRGANHQVLDEDLNTIMHMIVLNKHEIFRYIEDTDERMRTRNFVEDRVIRMVHELVEFIQEQIEDIDLEKWINTPNVYGKTPVFLAAESTLVLVVECLEEYGADFMVCDRYFGNSIVLAIIDSELNLPKNKLSEKAQMHMRKDHVWLVETLLEFGVNPDYLNPLKRTALELAVLHNLHHLTHVIVQFANDFSFLDSRRRTLLHLFLESLDKVKKPLVFEEKCLITMVKFFLERGMSVNIADYRGNTALHLAARMRLKGIIPLMTERFNAVHAYGNYETVLHCLLDHSDRLDQEYIDSVRHLISKGADLYALNKNSMTPLQLAAKHKHREVLDVFAEFDVNFNVFTEEDDNMLHFLSSSTVELEDNEAEREIVSFLAERGCPVNGQNKSGLEPMHVAAKTGNLGIVQGLLVYTPKLHSKSFSCSLPNPLHFAVMNDHEDVAKLLIDDGIPVNIRAPDGQTPLHMAARHSSTIMKTLLELGADMRLVDNDGRVPLHNVLQYDNIEGWEYLVEFGVNVNDLANSEQVPFQQLPKFNAVWNTMINYLVKLQAANMEIADAFKPYVYDKRMQYYFNQCTEEIEQMKSYLMVEEVSLYDLLLLSYYNKDGPFLEDIAIDRRLELFKVRFPLYYDLIRVYYRNLCVEPETYHKTDCTMMIIHDTKRSRDSCDNQPEPKIMRTE